MAISANDFTPFPYKIGSSTVKRYLFVKCNEETSEEKPPHRTLFIMNVPQYFNVNCLRLLFKEFGTIENIDLCQTPTSTEESVKNTSGDSQPLWSESHIGSQVACIVFSDPESVEEALSSNELRTVNAKLFASGKERWIEDYNNSFVDSGELQNDIDEFMSAFDQKVETEKIKEKEEADVGPDLDGWKTVTKRNKKKIIRKQAFRNKLVARKRARDSRLEIVNFYRNQMRDVKNSHLLELKKKFEEDKAKIALMRQNRKFKPF